ncbi:ubiquinol-cytochrome c reductase iron-sulfur subunit [Actinomycetospora termitidis]|uniref:Cytochrome bc1 complex Rieske iron-sulfur subunit n=1 Tax=Actinomycetospora termitidis TaxID=3053470 RepID=A0ABT7MCG2_9PSEU|nr:Rieske (2Fe-2S) protein [Actinomycetospora sp. Odt1-22]MDL5158356.1 Rieske (2Fe-2S) protein [Actinomycetospora sp. Odt1-22]
MADEATGQDRRSVLLAGAVFACGVAGCAPAPAPPSSADGDGGFAPGAPPAGAGVAGGPGTVLGPAAVVPVGGGVVYPAFAVVVVRATAEDYRGFSAVCPHDGCLVNEVADGSIVCPCHGSRFALDGAVTRGPAEDPLSVRPVRVDRGQVVLE